MNKDITDIAKDIKKIVDLDLTEDFEVTNKMVAAYLEEIGFTLQEDAFENDPLNAVKLPLSVIIDWLKENVIEFMEGSFVTGFDYTII